MGDLFTIIIGVTIASVIATILHRVFNRVAGAAPGAPQPPPAQVTIVAPNAAETGSRVSDIAEQIEREKKAIREHKDGDIHNFGVLSYICAFCAAFFGILIADSKEGMSAGPCAGFLALVAAGVAVGWLSHIPTRKIRDRIKRLQEAQEKLLLP